MKKIFKLVILAVSLLGILLLVFMYITWRLYLQPFDHFIAQARDTMPMLDALNADVYKELPQPPPNVVQSNIYSNGIDSPGNVIGRDMFVEYKNDTLNDMEVLSYYRSSLENDGWHEDHKSDSRSTYSKGNACIRISTYQNLHSYMLVIWHDFLAQEFSPEPPDMKSVYIYGKGPYNMWNIYMMGELTIRECPV